MTGFALLAGGHTPDQDASFHYASAYVGESVRLLGSEDYRRGFGAAFGSGRLARGLRIGRAKAFQTFEVYGLWTTSNGYNGDPKNQSYALGWLGYAQYRMGSLYVDFGAGLQDQTNRSTDLTTRFNSTPFLDLGFAPKGYARSNWTFAGRFLHISNAGTKLPNPGQNQIHLMITYHY